MTVRIGTRRRVAWVGGLRVRKRTGPGQGV